MKKNNYVKNKKKRKNTKGEGTLDWLRLKNYKLTKQELNKNTIDVNFNIVRLTNSSVQHRKKL